MQSFHLNITNWILIAVIALSPYERAYSRTAAEPTAGVAASSLPISTPKFQPNRVGPTVSPPSTNLRFSDPPTDSEIIRASIFEQPLIPFGSTQADENRALGNALHKFLNRTDKDDTSALTNFLAEFPASAWRVSILTGLGRVYRFKGYFTKAMNAWEDAWLAGRSETDPLRMDIVNVAVSQFAELNARVGRLEVLTPLLSEIRDRKFTGAPLQTIEGVRESLWLMQNRPEESFKCGPFALDRIRASLRREDAFAPLIIKARSSTNGTSLAEVAALAKQLRMHFRPAKRSVGAAVIIPSVVHWKLGHFAALIKDEGGHYLAQDPTFTYDITVSKAALDEESTGYFLVPEGPLPPGWSPVSDEEAQTVWGKGAAPNSDADRTTTCDKIVPNCGGHGMATYGFHVMLASLHISDTPLAYSPPRGPAVELNVVYNEREANQPNPFPYSNFGKNWAFSWLSFILEQDPGTGLTSAVGCGAAGGGTPRYSVDQLNNALYYQAATGEFLTNASGHWERLYRDGSREIYDVKQTAEPFNRLFMSKRIDPAGNALSFSYDANYRLVAVTDAVAQVTTIAYASTNSTDPLYKMISKVTDPFGRSASFSYDTNTLMLTNITDVIGINSGFSYSSTNMTSLTTPYGTTTFHTGISSFSGSGRNGGITRWIRWAQATDPLGQTEQVEYHDDAPGIPTSSLQLPAGISTFNDYLNARSSYYWDKKAWLDYPSNFTKAHNYHFLHVNGANVTSGVLESEKSPLESRIWYEYDGEPTAGVAGTNESPSKIARMLDDGATQLYQFAYNKHHRITKTIDPVGRTTTFTYASNFIDLLEIHQLVGSSSNLLARLTYGTNHMPLTAVDASGQTNFFGFNDYGQVTSITNPLAQVTTLAYNDIGQLTNITGALQGAVTSFTYDNTNRVRTITDSDGYTLTFDYDDFDRITKITFPDTTFQQVVYDKLDPVLIKDRRGHWTRNTYDALRRLTSTEDALGRITQFGWCSCGNLSTITDAIGRTTTWLRDVEGRPTAKIYPDGSQTTYGYEIATPRIKAVTDAKSQTTLYDYLLDNNLKQVSYSNAVIATPPVSLTYDTNYNRLTSITDGTGLTSYSYFDITDPPQLGAGRLATVDGPLTNDTVAFLYDQLRRVTNRAIDVIAQTVSFDSIGRPGIITNALGRFTNIYFGATWRIATNCYPNGQVTAFSYLGTNSDMRLQEIWNLSALGATISKFDYTYDPEGEILTWTQQAEANNPTVWVADYDLADQLLGVAIHTNSAVGATIKQFAYGYDKAANRTSESIQTADSPPQISTASINTLNQSTAINPGGPVRFKGHVSETGTVSVAGISATMMNKTNFIAYPALPLGTSTNSATATDLSNNTTSNRYEITITNNGLAETLSYDLNGNLASVISCNVTNTYDWDAADRLVRVTQILTNGSVATEFTYNGLGLTASIIQRQNGSATSTNQLLWCGTQISEIRDSSGTTVQKRFFADGEQVAATNYFLTRDHLKSIREVTGVDGTAHSRYQYEPYGRRTEVNGDFKSDFGFAGYFVDPDSGLDGALYRFYSAEWGRWISRDPIGERGGLNVYGYTQNSPIRLIDPTGTTTVYSGTPFPGQEGSYGPYTLNIPDGSTLLKPLIVLTPGQLFRAERNTCSDLDSKSLWDSIDPMDEAAFDTPYWDGQNKDSHQYYLYNNTVYAGWEINYYGIGMYESWAGDPLWVGQGLTIGWKLHYFSWPTSGVFFWLKKGYQDYDKFTIPTQPSPNPCN